jgi:hypothetical protein
MSVILRCTNDNGVIQDIQVQDQIDLRLDISAIENATIGEVYGISSQEFSLVGSNDVNSFFGNVWNLGSTPAVALQNSIDCQVLLNGAEVFKGKLYIKSIVTDSDGYNSLYNVVVVNETVDFKFEIQDLYLNQLDLSKFDHDLTYANVSASWGGGLKSGSIIYPFVNYGKPEADPDAPDYAFAAAITAGTNTIDNEGSPLRLIDFKPAIRAKDLVDAIFSGSSYDYTSSFFNTNYFENLYVLATANDQLGPNNVSPVSQSAWAYNESGSQTVSANTQVQVDFDAEVIDNANNFSLVTDRYTADTTGNYTYQINVNYTIGNYAPSTTDRVGIFLRKNGSTIVDSQFYFNPSATGSAFLQGGVSLLPSDYLEVEMSYTTNTGTRFLNILNEVGKPSYLPAGYQTYFQIKGPASLIGGNIEIAEQFPDDLKALDFLQGLIEKFNLVVEPVPNSRNLIRIEPYQNWINAGVQKDWTDKVDRATKYEIVHPITEQPRTIIFSDEEDTDVLNEYTINNLGKIFGSYTFVSDSDLAEGERRIGKTFAATPVTGVPNGRTFVVPHLCSVTDNREFRPIKFKPRLLYNNGLQTVPQSALGISGSVSTRGTIYVRDENSDVQSTTVWNQMNTLISIPANYDEGQDLHYNNDQYSQYFQASANGKVKADAYRTYWATYINSLYDIDARKLTCNVYIKPSEIQNIALNDKIFIDGHYYRINKINGANLTRRDTVEVELIKIIAQELKFPRRRVGNVDVALDYNSLSINGTGLYINTDTGAPVEDFNTVRQVASKDYMQIYNSSGTASVVWDYQVPVDTTSQFDQTILGTNRVDVGASKVNALGNNNQVKVGSETTLVVGSNNLIAENTSNVTALGTLHTVETLSSNIQLFGGVANSVSSSNNSTIMGGTGSLFVNNDNTIDINGTLGGVRDSDVTTAINRAQDEVIINGSGHTVIGLNLEGAGLDLLNTRNNSNWLGDTYLGESIFRDRVQLECGAGDFISLTGSLQGQGRHENLYVMNWSGFSPGTTTIELPSATNNDYKNVVYQFVSNGSFQGANGGLTQVDFVGFSGQTINGQSSYLLKNPYQSVVFTTSGSGWITLQDNVTNTYGAFYATGSQPLAATGTQQAIILNDGWEDYGMYIASGSRIYIENPGTYKLSATIQLSNYDNGAQDAVFWLKFNGTNWPYSSTRTTIRAAKVPGSNPSSTTVAMNFVGTSIAPNDYVELYWAGTDTDLSLEAYAGDDLGAGEPAASPISIMITPVS